MIFKRPKLNFVDSLFDTSEPSMYVIVLPVLIMTALGFRTQAIMFVLGALAFLTVVNSA